MEDHQNLFAQLVDTCKSNSMPCQAEMNFKVNYRSDKSQKVLWDSLDTLLLMMRGVVNEETEYRYPWIYTSKRNGAVYGGHYHGYPNSEVQSMNLEGFKSWWQSEVTAWAEKNNCTVEEVNPGKLCDAIVTIRISVPVIPAE